MVFKKYSLTLLLFRYNLVSELSSSISETELAIASGTGSFFDKAANVCLSVLNGRYGLLIIANDPADAKRKLAVVKNNLEANRPLRFAPADKIYTSKLEGRPAKIAFLFPGFGSEYPEMFDGLFEHFPFISNWLEVLRDVMVGMENYSTDTSHVVAKIREGLANNMYSTNNRGIISIVNSLACYHILMALGLHVEGMVGHSNGENAAMTAAGIFENEGNEGVISILRAVMGISELSTNERSGQYLAVSNFSVELIKELLLNFENEAFLAMKNCTNQNIVFVKDEVLEPVSKLIFDKRGIVIPMVAENPFHTPLFRKKTEVIKKIYSTMKIGPGTIPVYSCVDTLPISGDVSAIVDKAARQWTETVQFTDTISKMYGEGFNVFIEVGPNSKLTNFVKDILKGRNVVAITGNIAGKDTQETLMQLAGTLWINGVDVDFGIFDTEFNKTATVLPKSETSVMAAGNSTRVISSAQKTSIFDRHQELMKFFIEVQESSLMKFKNAYLNIELPEEKIISQQQPFLSAEWPLLSKPLTQTKDKLYIERHYDLAAEKFFGDHAFGKKLAVVAYTVSLEILAEAAGLLLGPEWKVVSLQDAVGYHWLVFDRDYLDLAISAELVSGVDTIVNGRKEVLVTIYNLEKKAGKKIKAFDGKVYLERNYKSAPPISNNWPEIVSPPKKNAPAFFRDFYFHGKYFMGIKEISGLDSSGLNAVINMPTLKGAFDQIPDPVFRVSGAFLDCCGQLAAFWLSDNGHDDFTVFPFKIDNYEQYLDFPKEGSAIKCQGIISKSQTTVTGEFVFYNAGGEVIAHMKGFQLRYFKNKWVNKLLMNRITPDHLSDLTSEFLEQGGAIWGRILAKLILKEGEYEEWLSMPPSNSGRSEILLDKLQLINI